MDETTLALKENAFEAYRKKNFKEAARLFTECIQRLENANAFLDVAEMRNNLSVVLLETKKADEALNALQGTDLVFAEAGDKRRQAMALGNIASAYQTLGRFADALTTFEQSSELFKEIGEKEMRAITLKKIADLQLKTGKQYQAMASLEAAYDQNEKKTIKEKVLKGFLGNLIKKITRKS